MGTELDRSSEPRPAWVIDARPADCRSFRGVIPRGYVRDATSRDSLVLFC